MRWSFCLAIFLSAFGVFSIAWGATEEAFDFAANLDSCLNEEFQRCPPFDIKPYEEKALKDLGYERKPEFSPKTVEKAILAELELDKPPTDEEAKTVFETVIENRVRKRFPPTARRKAEEEAKVKFKVIEKGEEVSVRLLDDGRYVTRTGPYNGMSASKAQVYVGTYKLQYFDLPEAFRERLDPEAVARKQLGYVRIQYDNPRKIYQQELREKYLDKYKDYTGMVRIYEKRLKKVVEKYNRLVEDLSGKAREKRQKEVVDKALAKGLTTFLERQQPKTLDFGTKRAESEPRFALFKLLPLDVPTRKELYGRRFLIEGVRKNFPKLCEERHYTPEENAATILTETSALTDLSKAIPGLEEKLEALKVKVIAIFAGVILGVILTLSLIVFLIARSQDPRKRKKRRRS